MWRKRTRNRKRKTSRYASYYKRMMEPIWYERWKTYLRQVEKLRKNIVNLGPVPNKESQLIKTVNHFVKLIDISTNFVDNHLCFWVPTEKAQETSNLNDMLIDLVGRKEGVGHYLNKANIGQRVTMNNLYLGFFSDPISDEEIEPGMKTIVINGTVRKVDVDFAPLSDWINNRVTSLDGQSARIRQKDLAVIIQEICSLLLETIDTVLEES